MGSLGVVIAAELVELALQAAQRSGPTPGAQPSLLGLVEPFDLAAGLGVIGP